MQPFHVEAIVNKDGEVILALPFPAGKKVDIVVLLAEESSEETAWKELAAEEFLRGYSTEDAAYDSYGK